MHENINGRSRRHFLVGSATAAASIGFVRSPAKAAQFEFKCASNQALDHPLTIGVSHMWAAIEKESGGRIRTQFFPNSQLGGDAAMFSQLREGAIQFFITNSGLLASVVPATDIAYLGFAYSTDDEGLRVMDGPLGAYLRQETAAKGIGMLRSMWNQGMNQIGSNSRPIQTPDDLHGFKIRVVESRITIDLFKTLGASPTPLSVSEIYTALQTKIIDGQNSPMVSIEAAKWYEVEKYISLTNHQWTGNWIVVNADAWKSLPPDLQAIVERNNTKYALQERKDFKVADAAVTAKLRSQGLAINQVDQAAFRARLRPYYETWSKNFGPTEWNLLQNSLRQKLLT